MRTQTNQLEIGMIWFMGDEEIRKSITDAAEYYEEKYNVVVNECHAHPDTLENARTVNGIKCVVDMSIRPKHLWIGKND